MASSKHHRDLLAGDVHTTIEYDVADQAARFALDLSVPSVEINFGKACYQRDNKRVYICLVERDTGSPNYGINDASAWTDITASAAGGQPITVFDNGSLQTGNLASINFVGATVSTIGDAVRIEIAPGGAVDSVTGSTGISVGGTPTDPVISIGSMLLADLNSAVSDATLIDTNDARLSNDRTASGLRTATTVVSISAATAPTEGQILIVDAGAATASWQDNNAIDWTIDQSPTYSINTANVPTFSLLNTTPGLVPGSNNQSTYILYGNGVWAPAPTGTGDVASTSNLTNLAITVGDGGGNKNIKSSVVSIDALGNLTGVGTYGGITVIDWTVTGVQDIHADRFGNLPTASTTVAGIVELATSVEITAGLAVQASDTRLSDSRTPTSHASTHAGIGGDPVDHDTLTNYVAEQHINWTTDQSLTYTIDPANVPTFSLLDATPGLVVGSATAGNTFFLRADNTWAEVATTDTDNPGVGEFEYAGVQPSTAVPPGTGQWTRSHTADISVVHINIHYTTRNGFNAKSIFDNLAAGSHFIMRIGGQDQSYVLGTKTDNGTWASIPATHVANSTSWPGLTATDVHSIALYAGPTLSATVDVENTGGLVVSTGTLKFIGGGVTVVENPAGVAEITVSSGGGTVDTVSGGTGLTQTPPGGTGTVVLNISAGDDSIQVNADDIVVKRDTVAASGKLSISLNGIKVGDGEIDSQQLALGAVDYANIQNVALNNVLLGNTAGAGSAIQELSGTAVTAILNTFTEAAKGLVPAPITAANKFLRDDQTWQPVGTGNVSFTTGTVVANQIAVFGANGTELKGGADAPVVDLATNTITLKNLTVTDGGATEKTEYLEWGIHPGHLRTTEFYIGNIPMDAPIDIFIIGQGSSTGAAPGTKGGDMNVYGGYSWGAATANGGDVNISGGGTASVGGLLGKILMEGREIQVNTGGFTLATKATKPRSDQLGFGQLWAQSGSAGANTLHYTNGAGTDINLSNAAIVATGTNTDNRIVRIDGTGRGVQQSGITISDTNDVTGVGTITAVTVAGTTSVQVGNTIRITEQSAPVVPGGTPGFGQLWTQASSHRLIFSNGFTGADSQVLLASDIGSSVQAAGSYLTAETNNLETAMANVAQHEVPVGTTGGGAAVYRPLTSGAVSYNTGTETFAQANFADLGTKTHTHEDAANGGTLAVTAITAQSDSGVIVFGTAGAPSYLGPGTSGTYLRSNGTGVAPTWSGNVASTWIQATDPVITNPSDLKLGDVWMDTTVPSVSTYKVRMAIP